MAICLEDFTGMSERTECSNKSRCPTRAINASGSVCYVNGETGEEYQDEY